VRILRATKLVVLVHEATSHLALFAFSEIYAHPTLVEVRVAATGTRTRQEVVVEVKLEC
jgi:hypothetical protein